MQPLFVEDLARAIYTIAMVRLVAYVFFVTQFWMVEVATVMSLCRCDSRRTLTCTSVKSTTWLAQRTTLTARCVCVFVCVCACLSLSLLLGSALKLLIPFLKLLCPFGMVSWRSWWSTCSSKSERCLHRS